MITLVARFLINIHVVVRPEQKMESKRRTSPAKRNSKFLWLLGKIRKKINLPFSKKCKIP